MGFIMPTMNRIAAHAVSLAFVALGAIAFSASPASGSPIESLAKQQVPAAPAAPPALKVPDGNKVVAALDGAGRPRRQGL